ncbi:unnamed protein product [Closterium sp. Naga37s-1]|nr:unnamed protein product [Closterium sp. Naga37s-1]
MVPSDNGFVWQVTQERGKKQPSSERTEKEQRKVDDAEERFIRSSEEKEGKEELTGAAKHRTHLCGVRWDRQLANERVTGGECSQDAAIFVSASGRLLQWDMAPIAATAQQRAHEANNAPAESQHSPSAPQHSYPLLPSLPHWVTITSVSVGLQHCLALSGDSSGACLLCCVLLPPPSSPVSAALHHCPALSRSGMVWAWGEGGEGDEMQMGFESNQHTHESSRLPAPSTLYPEQAVECSQWNGVGVGRGRAGYGMVWAWGEGGEGQLGVGRRVGKVTVPVCVMLPASPAASVISNRDDSLQATAVACGGRHSLVLAGGGWLALLLWMGPVWAEDGSSPPCPFSFGRGQYRQCGHGTSDDHLSPTRLASFAGLSVTAIAAGLWHSLALALPAGSISNCGAATGGGGGGGGAAAAAGVDDHLSPTRLTSFAGLSVTAIAAGLWHSLALALPAGSISNCGAATGGGSGAAAAADVEVGSDDVELEGGDVYSWGGNQFGQLGTGDTEAKV